MRKLQLLKVGFDHVVSSLSCFSLHVFVLTKADHTRGNFVTGDTATLSFVPVVHEILHGIHSTSPLEIDGWSILKQLVEYSIQYFHAQHPQTMMLPATKAASYMVYLRPGTRYDAGIVSVMNIAGNAFCFAGQMLS